MKIKTLLTSSILISSVLWAETTLQTDIPDEQIEGTPMPVKVPNVEQAATSMPLINVPEGTVLLSRGKPVTASDDFTIVGDLEYITDGDKLSSEGYYTELIDQLQWVTIDLEEEKNIEAIWVWHFHSQARAYHDVIMQISNDENFESGVTTVFNNDYDNSAGFGKGKNRPYIETRFGKVVDVNGVKGRYVRLYSNGNTADSGNHYIEVEVYGQ